MFKPYVVAMTDRGAKVFPSRIFEDLFAGSAFPWACLVESQDDENLFLMSRPECAWLVKLAQKRGYSAATMQRK